MRLTEIPAELRRIVTTALNPGQFAVREGLQIEIAGPSEQTWRWEILGGQLLPDAFTREERNYVVWTVSLRGNEASGATAQPLVTVLASEEKVFVVRHILTHGVETYEEEPNVILTRPAQVWIRELVGSVPIDRAERLLKELLLKAFVGASRLPVTSRESPLPAFSLGQCAYLATDAPTGPNLPACKSEKLIEDIAQAIAMEATEATRPERRRGGNLRTSQSKPPERAAKWLEFALRATDDADVPALARKLVEKNSERATHPDPGIRMGPDQPGAYFTCDLLLEVFNNAALTPYTGYCDRFVKFLSELAAAPAIGEEPIVDAVGRMLWLLARHLTAFDLTTFHSYGADYPDLLFLDALLKWYLAPVEASPELFLDQPGDNQITSNKRLRRRGLRQAWLLRRQYQGLRVPAVPTSQGENQRVLPAEIPHLNDEEILQPAKRTRQLFEDDLLILRPDGNIRTVLEASLAELAKFGELRELGTALFLDRPLGYFKPPGHVDATPLLSYVAFSRHIARQRLAMLQQWGLLSETQTAALQKLLEAQWVTGQRASLLPGQGRVGVVSLEDCHKAAPDFVFQHTTWRSLDHFFSQFDLAALQQPFPDIAHWLRHGMHVLLIRTAAENSAHGPFVLTAFDADMQPRAVFSLCPRDGQPPQYVEIAGQEYLRDGLSLIWPARATLKSLI